MLSQMIFPSLHNGTGFLQATPVSILYDSGKILYSFVFCYTFFPLGSPLTLPDKEQNEPFLQGILITCSGTCYLETKLVALGMLLRIILVLILLNRQSQNFWNYICILIL